MEHTDQQFTGKTVPVDGNRFIRCQFTDCVMEYAGGKPPQITDCKMMNVQWSFSGAAANTVAFMQAIYHGMGEGGQQLINRTFDNIRQGQTPTAAGPVQQ